MEKDNVLKRMRNATLTQAGIAIVSVGLGIWTGNLAYSSEAEHSGSDTATHGLRYFIEKKGWNQHGRLVQAALKGSLLIPAGFLAHTSFKAGLEIHNNIIPERFPVVNILGAFSISTANYYAEHELESVRTYSPATETSHTHAFADKWFSLLISAGLVGEVALGHGVSNYTTAVVGGIASLHLIHEAFKPHHH